MIDGVVGPIHRTLERITHSKWIINVDFEFSEKIYFGDDSRDDLKARGVSQRQNENANKKSLNVDGESYHMSSEVDIVLQYQNLYHEKYDTPYDPPLQSLFSEMVLFFTGGVKLARTVIGVYKSIDWLDATVNQSKVLEIANKSEDRIKGEFLFAAQRIKNLPKPQVCYII